jgi:hypothetical protein
MIKMNNRAAEVVCLTSHRVHDQVIPSAAEIRCGAGPVELASAVKPAPGS